MNHEANIRTMDKGNIIIVFYRQKTNQDQGTKKNLLLQAGLVFRAVLLNVYLHQWERALDLAVKVQTDICCENIVNFLMER